MRKNDEEQIQGLEAFYKIGKVLASKLKIEGKVIKRIIQKVSNLTKSDYERLGMDTKERTQLFFDIIFPEGEILEVPKPIPYKVGEMFIDVHNGESPEIGVFDENQQMFLGAFASLLVIASLNAMQYQELKDTQEQLAAKEGFTCLSTVVSIWLHGSKQKIEAILGNIETIKRYKFDKLDEEAREIVKDIEESAIKMRDIIKLPTDTEEPTTLNINSIIKRVLDETKVFPEIKIEVVYDDDLPLILADSQWLSMGVFTNLISNSLRAMPKGGLLKIITRRIERGVEVEVTDTGSGIPSRVAESPQFLKGQIKGTEGSGIGLFLVGTTIKRYGGEIKLTKTDSNGTTFTFWLPSAKSEKIYGE